MFKKNLTFKEITSCTDDQIKKIRDLRNLENVRKFMYTDHIITEQEHINYITKLKNDKKNLVFIIFNHTNEIIGLVSLNSIDKLHKKADWAFYTNPEIKNIGGVIEYYFIEFFFNQLNFEKLNCEVIENNISTRKLHKKFLFEEKEIKKDNIIKNNRRINVYFYGLTKFNWNNRKSELSKFNIFFNKYSVKFEFNKNFLK
jgi:UDP-4-amino-4,6-dideoxy-N-acetyl-beta-L-altrosamine N-acetyltransferase